MVSTAQSKRRSITMLLLLIGTVILPLSSRAAFVYETVARFGINRDGANPNGQLVTSPDGKLYGTTASGGKNGTGVVFRIGPQGKYQVVHTFDATAGWSLASQLAVDGAGNLYGFKRNTDQKTDVFRLDPQGNFSVLYSVELPGSPSIGPLGTNEGSLYGTTVKYVHGESTYVVYRIDPGGKLEVLHTVSPKPDLQPTGVTLDIAPDGTVSGTTWFGGSHLPQHFAIDPSGRYSVVSGNGVPDGAAQGSDLATSGPVTDFCADSASMFTVPPITRADGTRFGLVTDPTKEVNSGWLVIKCDRKGKQTIVSRLDSTFGREPNGLAFGSDGTLYGTMAYEGAGGYGSVFKIDKVGNAKVLRHFAMPHGYFPRGPLQVDGTGRVYGIASGGRKNRGLVFRIDQSGRSEILYELPSQDACRGNVTSRLAPNGWIYGVSKVGGHEDWGTLYRVDSEGNCRLLQAFGPESGRPSYGFARGKDGKWYGLADSGGPFKSGGIYRWDAMTGIHLIYPNSPFQINYDFNIAVDVKGNVYAHGHAKSSEYIVRIAPDGAVTKLHRFDRKSGVGVMGGLTLGHDGALYGITIGGGAFDDGKLDYDGGPDDGTLFKLDRKGRYTVLHNFHDNPQYIGLIAGPDGSLFGVMYPGKVVPFQAAVVYRVDPDGRFGIIHTFKSVLEGNTLMQMTAGPDGSLYGIGGGGVFRLRSDDADFDGVSNDTDNCTWAANPDQRDTDGDGYGNYCDADLNNSGRVSRKDLALFAIRAVSSEPDADFNGDGVVNRKDLERLRALLGKRPGPNWASYNRH